MNIGKKKTVSYAMQCNQKPESLQSAIKCHQRKTLFSIVAHERNYSRSAEVSQVGLENEDAF